MKEELKQKAEIELLQIKIEKWNVAEIVNILILMSLIIVIREFTEKDNMFAVSGSLGIKEIKEKWVRKNIK